MYRQEKLQRGTTHVAVGFVDLGVLFEADLGEASSTQSKVAPLHFLSIERSAYSVAKTLLLWELLKHTPSTFPQRQKHLFSVAQVWFSTTWGAETEAAVKGALSVLCSSNGPHHHHPLVRELLYHWYSASSVSLKAARMAHAEATTESRSGIGHFLHKHDRLAMAKYQLTGDFCVNGDPTCGSIVMFECPDGTPPLPKDETVFSTFRWSSIMDILKRDAGSTTTIMEAAEMYAFDGLAKLATWASHGDVTLELKCGPFEDMIDEIAARKPWSMSWSNLPDYFDYSAFHRMARRCSIHGDTIHFGSSMNWVTDVFGTYIIDFDRCKEHTDLRTSIIDAANESVGQACRIMGLDQRLRSVSGS